ncbi:MAG: hypothetical protein V2J51_11400 [Erythrobacter sp.]|jgi:hypothetical protein|nr:hypothetical protein [Erythrobacter sp.]
MNIVFVRYCFGAIILTAHFGSIGLYFYFGLRLLDGIEQAVGLILSIAPLTALYFTAFLRYVVGDDGGEQPRIVPKRAFYVQLSVILIFCTFLLPAGLALFISGEIDYQNIGIFTGLVETLFAAYMAIIFNSLFPEIMTAAAE